MPDPGAPTHFPGLEAGASSGLKLKRLLYDPVFEAVKADHNQTGADSQGLNRAFEESVQSFQFLIDRDPESLEDEGCRVQP